MWHSTRCGHAAINATTHTRMTPPDRTGTPAEVDETTCIIMDGTRDVIGRITAVIVDITKVTETTMEILPVAVGYDLMAQIGPLN